MEKISSISQLINNGLYEIHPCNNDTVSGIIQVIDGKLLDYSSKEEYTEEEICNIEMFEEEHPVYYIQKQ